MNAKHFIFACISVCIISLLCLLFRCNIFSEKTISLAQAVTLAQEQAQYLNDVGGFGGFVITPTPFLIFSTILIEGGTTNMYMEFLQSTNPVTRAMGLTCLARTDKQALVRASSALLNPNQEITVWDMGCLPTSMTLGQLASNLKARPNFLGHDDDYWDFQKLRQQIKNGKVPLEIIKQYSHHDYSNVEEDARRDNRKPGPLGISLFP